MRSAMNSEKADWAVVASFFGEMRAKLDRVMSMIENTPSALIMANKDLAIEYTNPATDALFKQSRGSFDIPRNPLKGSSFAVEEQSATTGEISRSFVVTSRGSTEIAENITDVASGARYTPDGAKDTRKSADELATSASKLHKLVNYFNFAA